jgi:hypothetical protein
MRSLSEWDSPVKSRNEGLTPSPTERRPDPVAVPVRSVLILARSCWQQLPGAGGSFLELAESVGVLNFAEWRCAERDRL